MRPPRPPRDPKRPAAQRSTSPRDKQPRSKSPSAIARDQRRAEQHAAAHGEPRPQRPTSAKAAGPRRAPAAPQADGALGDGRRRPAQHAAARGEPRPQRPAPPKAPPTPRRVPAAPRAEAAPGEGQRIAKLLARAGVASRREIERMIADRRIAIDGVPIETPATLLRNLHNVTVDGKPVAPPTATRLFRFHKPTGFLTAERDPKGRPTIYDRLPSDLPRVMPIGRLDLNTEGLLLLTTDGEFKRQLELPATGVERSYRARVFGEVSQQQLESLIEGVEIDGIRYGSIDANLERRTGRNGWVEMRLREGKNREVRRVLEYLGLQVSRLIRTSYGPFHLGDLPAGAVDEVRQHELVEFRKTLKR